MFSVSISAAPIDPQSLLAAFPVESEATGAVVTFSGHVRGSGIKALALEHYPGMTEGRIEAMVASAERRWPIQAAQVVHRVGVLAPGEPIVWVAVASAHRAAAFSACEFIMDYLKVSAPLWKREQNLDGQWAWVEARERDDDRARRWGSASGISGEQETAPT